MNAFLLGPVPDAVPARVEATREKGATVLLGVGLDFGGFHPMDDYDRAVGGAWMGRSCELLLPESGGRVLRVDGEHRGDLHERSAGETRIVLRVAVDGEPAGEFVLDEHGEFSHSVDLVRSSARRSKLSIEADRTFVPMDLGDGDDHRELSVRVKRITLDGDPLLDFSVEGSPYRVKRSARQLGFNIVGYLRSELGVGESGRLCATAAEAAGIPFAMVDFSKGCSSRADDDRWESAISGRNPHPVNVIHVNADQMPVLYEELGPGFFADRYNIGVWHWELPEFPDEWLQAFAYVQEIWAPTRFVADAISAKSPVPVVLMPHAIAFDSPQAPTRKRFGLPERDFLFLTMYDMHSFQARKNPEGVIEAFSKAFADTQGVGLVIKLMNAKTYPRDYAALRKRLKGLPGTYLIDETLAREDVYALESVCDSFVSLHRSEGFGLGLAESMYLGKPVIGTHWSGNVDFMTSENSCPVGYSLVELERDHGPYRKGQHWAEPDLDQAAAHMRRLVSDPEWRRRIAAEGQRSIARDHSPEAIGLRYQRRLRVISRLL